MRIAMTVFIMSGLITAAVAGADDDATLGRWIFDHEHIAGSTVRAAAGTLDGLIAGPIRFDQLPVALRLDGAATRVTLSETPPSTGLPTDAFTAECWVAVYGQHKWGGIIGLIQDDGAAQKGWLLGIRANRFVFGLSTEGAGVPEGRLTYVMTETPIAYGKWRHVAATYDGRAMRLYVNGQLEAESDEQSGSILYPEAAPFEIGTYRDANDLHLSNINLVEVSLYGRAMTPEEIARRFASRKDLAGAGRALPFGPYLRFTGSDRALVRWHTSEPTASVLEYQGAGAADRIVDPTPKTAHQIEWSGLRRDTSYRYRIVLGEGSGQSPWYLCDTTFDYTLPTMPDPPADHDDASAGRIAAAAEEILARTGIRQGYCLDIGSGTGRLAYEIARRSDLIVVGVDTDPEAIARARNRLGEWGAYGPRVTMRHVEDYAALPFTQCFANLIVSERAITDGAFAGSLEELWRVLRPNGGAACLPGSQRAAVEGALAPVAPAPAFDEPGDALWTVFRRSGLPGAGQWTHQYGSADNSARSGETLQGATGADQLAVQWVGRPGPRAMVDRNPRTPAPLNANGRLFVQGHNRIIALDAFNGAIYWSAEIPALQRFNMPRDGSNWCADDDWLYVAVADACWRMNGQTGELAQRYAVPLPRRAGAYEWGYIAQTDDILFGSAVQEGTVFTNYWGKADSGWYDTPRGEVTHKVCSDLLFALSKDSGEMLWRHEGGVIINSAVAVADGCVYFVECRHPAVLSADSRRVGAPEMWTDLHLVAKDARSGETRWERDVSGIDGSVVFFLVHAHDTLLIAASDLRYNLHAFAASDGRELWSAGHEWTAKDHSGHMQHPAVLGRTVYLEPCGYDIATGETVTDAMGRHEGCATYAATEQALIYRGAGRRVAMWDPASGKVTTWNRLRPSCWLSTIAGDGMVLSPEGGGGCSCGGWMETSLAMMPGIR